MDLPLPVINTLIYSLSRGVIRRRSAIDRRSQDEDSQSSRPQACQISLPVYNLSPPKRERRLHLESTNSARVVARSTHYRIAHQTQAMSAEDFPPRLVRAMDDFLILHGDTRFVTVETNEQPRKAQDDQLLQLAGAQSDHRSFSSTTSNAHGLTMSPVHVPPLSSMGSSCNSPDRRSSNASDDTWSKWQTPRSSSVGFTRSGTPSLCDQSLAQTYAHRSRSVGSASRPPPTKHGIPVVLPDKFDWIEAAHKRFSR